MSGSLEFMVIPSPNTQELFSTLFLNLLLIFWWALQLPRLLSRIKLMLPRSTLKIWRWPAGKWRLTNQPEPVKLLIVLELFTFLGRPGKNWLSELKLWKVTSDKSATFSQYLIYALKLSCRLYSTSTAWETCRWLSCRRLFTPKSFYKQENLQLLIS